MFFPETAFIFPISISLRKCLSTYFHLSTWRRVSEKMLEDLPFHERSNFSCDLPPHSSTGSTLEICQGIETQLLPDLSRQALWRLRTSYFGKFQPS